VVTSFSKTLAGKMPVGLAMGQAVCRWHLKKEANVAARDNPRGIFGGQSETETSFSPTSSGFPCHYHSIVALHTHISPEV
jgi:hypothetical protein